MHHKKHRLHATHASLWHALQIIYRCDPKLCVLKVIYITLLSLLPLVNLYVLKCMVDSVVHLGNTAGAVLAPLNMRWYVIIFCGIYLLTRILNVLDSVNTDVLTQKLIDYINNLIQTQSIALDMVYYDNSEYHDSFHRAQQEAAYRPVRILENYVSVFGAVVSLLGILAMLFKTSWLVIVVMVIAILPAFFVRLHKSKSVYNFRNETTPQTRRANYLGQLISNRAYAQEVRSFALGNYFKKSYINIRHQLFITFRKISYRIAVYDGLTAIIETGALFFVMILLLRPTMAGVISVGTFVMLFEAFRRGQSYLGNLVTSVSGLYEHELFIRNLYKFLALRPGIVSPTLPVPFPKDIDCVEFRDVTFGYPNNHTYTSEKSVEKAPNKDGADLQSVLTHFDFVARKNEITLLQGENGFGKTTALKLLLRLYDPQGGAIFINNIDIRQFDLNELRHAVAAIFQDHAHFFFTAEDNIYFGNIESPLNESRIRQAANLSGAASVIDKLPQGYNTMLGCQFNDGKELSMGQWQRVALARLLYSDAPIMVFDEPTAWMDSNTQNLFLSGLQQIRKDKVIILISHETTPLQP